MIASSYSTDLVVLSIVVACLASYAALDLAGHLARRGASRRWLAAAAVTMGAGIWSMHFIGMLALRLPVAVAYDVSTVAASLLIAVLGSGIGLRVAGQERPGMRAIAVSGPAMGLAIAGMHYTGMAAMRLPATQHYAAGRVLLSILIAIVASHAAIGLFLRFRFDRSRRGTWLKAGSAVIMGHAVAGMHYTAMWAVHFGHAPDRPGGVELPAQQIGTLLAAATILLLLFMLGSTMVDRWVVAQAQVRRSEERFRAMVDALTDHAVYTLDADGRVDSWNRGAERLLGWTSEEVMGRELGSTAIRDGIGRRITATTAPMHGADGRLLGFARVVRDVTMERQAREELERSEAQLRQSQKMEAVGKLAGGVAHDFNNMLTAIRGNAELLRAETAPGSDAHESLTEITVAADRAAELTRHLLAFSRKQVLQPATVNPNDVVTEIERMLRRLLVGDVQLVTELAADVGHITVDPAQLQQVLLNLALNARDALPRGGTVTIRTANVELTDDFVAAHPGSRPGPHVLLSVRDDGEGIPPDVQEHVFEPFFTTKALGHGTGLGLSTAYGIVKQSGGYIWLESEVGVGTTFSICLPRSSPVPSAAQRRDPEPRFSGEHGTVLLVDDEDPVRRMAARVLARAGYHVLAASGGAEAIAMLEEHGERVDLLITDMMMPGMNGRELAARATAKHPEIIVLYISGYAGDDVIERGLLDPSMAFIEKPFAAAQLLDKVRELLSSRTVRLA